MLDMGRLLYSITLRERAAVEAEETRLAADVNPVFSPSSASGRDSVLANRSSTSSYTPDPPPPMVRDPVNGLNAANNRRVLEWLVSYSEVCSSVYIRSRANLVCFESSIPRSFRTRGINMAVRRNVLKDFGTILVRCKFVPHRSLSS